MGWVCGVFGVWGGVWCVCMVLGVCVCEVCVWWGGSVSGVCSSEHQKHGFSHVSIRWVAKGTIQCTFSFDQKKEE